MSRWENSRFGRGRFSQSRFDRPRFGAVVTGGGGGPNLFAPVQGLYEGSEKGILHNYSHLDTLFEDFAKTIPASVDGQVYQVTDLSGNNASFYEAWFSSTRPFLRNEGVYYSLDYSGNKGGTIVPSGTGTLSFPQPFTMFFAAKAPSSPTGFLFNDDTIKFKADATYTISAGSDASSSVPPTTDFFYMQIEFNGSSTVFRYNGAEETLNPGASASGTNTLYVGNTYNSSSSFSWNGRIYGWGIIDRALTSLEKTTVDTWLASLG